ncbi:transcription termination factor Rho [Mycobacterium sp. djl-10]|nr:transcription termination factor Rho [Mycobacterium sp. djl-10]
MTDTDLITADSASQTELPGVTADTSAPRGSAAVSSDKSSGSLTSMVLPELRALAARVGVKGTSGMRKGDLIAAIRERQASAPATGADRPNEAAAPTDSAPAPEAAPAEAPRRRERRSASRQSGSPAGDTAADQPKQDSRPERADKAGAKAAEVKAPETKAPETKAAETKAAEPEAEKAPAQEAPRQQDRGDQQGGEQSNRRDRDRNNDRNESNRNNERNDSNRNESNRNNDRNESNRNNQNNNQNNDGDDDGEGRGGRRGRRFRDRKRRGERGGGGEGGNDTELRDDDVVQPVAGILDVLDNYAFVRTSGYLAGPNDVYVSMNMVRKNGLRRGDAVTGAVRVPREGDSNSQNPRQKFNPLVRLDTVNGGPVDAAKNRPEFGKLTPLYPNQRLRLETGPDKLTTRVIDLIMPIGKGQRALIVSPPKAGKTTIMQDIANAITRNNPECHLMVVLVDERPEEVTDMQRSVKGEVIASTFDRPPSDHTQAAELAIERAKRLVEQGKDVVVLLDSITRLGRAYNNASPASGRILSGGVDSTALYPPKRFLGAARNIEHGGSLTIIATAMVETGSTGDTVIFEEFKGTGNAELKLDRKIAERRVFPAVDVNPSGTRKDELLLGPDEFAIVHKLRRVLSGLDSHQAIDLLMSQLRKTKTNYEFLVQVSKTAPGSMDDRD